MIDKKAPYFNLFTVNTLETEQANEKASGIKFLQGNKKGTRSSTATLSKGNVQNYTYGQKY